MIGKSNSFSNGKKNTTVWISFSNVSHKSYEKYKNKSSLNINTKNEVYVDEKMYKVDRKVIQWNVAKCNKMIDI